MSGEGVGPSTAREWQALWHAILDQHGVEPDDPSNLSRPLPPMDEDFRLQFSFWKLPRDQGAQARRSAFAPMPRGLMIAERVERYLSAPPRRMPVEEAKAVLSQGLTLLRDLGLKTADDLERIRVLDQTHIPFLVAFQQADTPFVALRDDLPRRARQECGDRGDEAFFFLAEPLYRLDSSYDIRDWALWPLCAPLNHPDATEAAYRLRMGGWLPGWDEAGLFLFRDPDLPLP